MEQERITLHLTEPTKFFDHGTIRIIKEIGYAPNLPMIVIDGQSYVSMPTGGRDPQVGILLPIKEKEEEFDAIRQRGQEIMYKRYEEEEERIAKAVEKYGPEKAKELHRLKYGL